MFKKRKPFEAVLTFPEPVQALVQETYARASHILEYGSGGSTMLAASLGKPVIAIESDSNWARQMNEKLAADHPQSPAEVIYKNIGKTGRWGKPIKPDGALNYHTYPMAIWDEPGFVQPDVILIDGRFRTACFCASIMRLEQPATILFDDYLQRESYHQVEQLFKPTRLIERMAVFEVEPKPIPPAAFGWMIPSFFQTTYEKDPPSETATSESV